MHDYILHQYMASYLLYEQRENIIILNIVSHIIYVCSIYNSLVDVYHGYKSTTVPFYAAHGNFIVDVYHGNTITTILCYPWLLLQFDDLYHVRKLDNSYRFWAL